MRISDWSSDVCSSDLNFVESLAVENPEPVRSSDFNEMFATGLVPMGIVREGFGRVAELLRHIGEHRSGRDFTRFQRPARPSHIEYETRVAEPGGIAATAADNFQDVPGQRIVPP